MACVGSCATGPRRPSKLDPHRPSQDGAAEEPAATAAASTATSASGTLVAGPKSSADATPTTAHGGLPPPLPPTPAGIEPERFEILASVCAVASWTGPDGETMVGCRSTPPFDGRDERPDGQVRPAASSAQVCYLRDFYRGSFSARGKDEAILGLAACGPDRVSGITPDNVVLAERGDAGWQVTAVEPDTNVHACRILNRPDRTLLACRDNVGAFGDGSLWWRFTLDFSQPSGARRQLFERLYESAPTSCSSGPELLVDRGVTSLELEFERFADVDGDGSLDLTAGIKRGYVPGSESVRSKFEQLCQKESMVEPESFVRPARYVLQYRGSATTLSPTPATAKLLESWRQQSPEFWWNVPEQ